MKAIDPDLLLRAYSIGVFPMADSRAADDVYWVEPKKRGIMPLDGFRHARNMRGCAVAQNKSRGAWFE